MIPNTVVVADIEELEDLYKVLKQNKLYFGKS
ncbi:hypothetical protein SAMN04487786_1102 [Paenisporosarcina quisquiliarum]|nr:hypothetical protein SAMN04487786_1102 [Paenisporosarcina quisquiliarum]